MKKNLFFLSFILLMAGVSWAQNVAKIGTTEYTTLQVALDAAHEMTGDVTIELLKNIEGYSIVHQKAGLNLTIDGADHTIAGQIIVDGDGRANGTETLTITNVNFRDDKTNFYTGTDAFVLVPNTKTSGTPYYTNKYNYAHNITVSACDFASTSSNLDVVGFKATSGAGNYNTVINNVTGNNLHSLAQFTGTTGATIINDTVTSSKSFVNVSGGEGEYYISSCSFTSAGTDGYAVRELSNSSAEIILTDNHFESTSVLQLGKNGGSNTSGHINVVSGTYYGALNNAQSAEGTATFVFTGGTFSEPKATVDGWCAEGYSAVADDPSAGYCTVRKIVVAKIGTTEYPTLQAAVDAAYAMTGDVTIELVANPAEHVLVKQKAGLNLTIDGQDHVLTGQIVVDGMGRSGESETLIITNINFVLASDQLTGDWKDADAFVCFPNTRTTGKPWYSEPVHYNYAHNVTVSNCTMDASGAETGMVGVKCPGQGAFNITVDNVTISNAHSLAQFTSTENIIITNCTATENMYHGVSITGGNNHEVLISGNKIMVYDDYGIRVKGTGIRYVTLSNDTVNAPNAVLINNLVENSTLNITGGQYIGNPDENALVVQNELTEINITGGTFSEDVTEHCATGYAAFKISTSPDRWKVTKAFRVAFEANGGMGTMDTALVCIDSIFKAPACTFTNNASAFTGWNSKSDGSGHSCAVGDVLVLTSDTTLYAQWGGVVYNSTKDIFYTTLQAAIDGADANDEIKILADLNLSAFINLNKSLNIDGGKQLITSTATRGMRVTEGNINLTLKNINLKMSNQERGISIDGDKDHVTIVMDSCRIYDVSHYAINVVPGTAHLYMTVTNSYLQAWAVLNSYADTSTFIFDRDTLIGINKYSCADGAYNNFSTIVLDGNGLFGDGLSSVNTLVDITNSVVKAETTEDCEQGWLSIQYNASKNTIRVDDNTIIIDGDENDHTDAINIGQLGDGGNTIFQTLTPAQEESLRGSGFTVEKRGDNIYAIYYNTLYSWPYTSGADSAYTDFHAPYRNGWIENGESLKLLDNVTMHDTLSLSDNDTITINFNGFNINKGIYTIQLAQTAVVHTNAQTDIFTSLNAEGNVMELDHGDGNYTYYVYLYNLITYDPNGGTGTIEPQQKPYGETVTLSDGTGFSHATDVLCGWNTKADGTGGAFNLGGTSYSENKDTTLYAVWCSGLVVTHVSSTNISCYGLNNGEVSVNIAGGIPPYQYVLLGGALTQNDTAKNITTTTHTFTDLKPGTAYYVIVSDATQIATSTQVDITEPDTLTAILTLPEDPCPMQTDYPVSVSTTGGNGGNTYVWGDDADNVNAYQTLVTRSTDDYATTYTVSVTVSDSKACTATATGTFTVSAVVDEADGRFTFTCPADIEKKLWQYCEIKITDFGNPAYSASTGGYEGIVTITNNIATVLPDSVLQAGDTVFITWTAIDTCGFSTSCEQRIVVSFHDCPTATDGDGNSYTSVRLGSNCICWMTSNMKTTKYSNSDRDVNNVMSYISENFPNVNENVSNFGYLYDWYAAVDTATNSLATIAANHDNGIRTQGICPEGWFLPLLTDFTALEIHPTADLRSTGYWLESGGTNATGFNAVPSGHYNSATGRYENAAGNAYYWSCHPVYDKATGAMIDYICEKIVNNLSYERSNGLSVRCVFYKENE